MTASIAESRPDDNPTYLSIPGHRGAGRRLGSYDGWVRQYDGSHRPVRPSDLELRDELACDVAENHRKLAAMLAEVEAQLLAAAAERDERDLHEVSESSPEDRLVVRHRREAVAKAIADLQGVQRQLTGMHRRPDTAMSERRCGRPPVRRNTRRAPRRTRSARTARATADPDPEPESDSRRCPRLDRRGGGK